MNVLASAIEGFASNDLATRRKAIAMAEAEYKKVTGESSQKEGGKYYDDRFILFLDAYDGIHYSFSREKMEPVLSAYTFALELIAPFWLWSIAKADIYLKQRITEILDDPSTSTQAKMVAVGRVYLDISQGKIPVAEIQNTPAFQTWSKSIQSLLSLRNDLLEEADLSKKRITFSKDDASVIRYRQTLQKVMSSSEHVLPLYASCAVFQIATEDSAPPKIVFDSAVFGNCMNLMIVNALSLDVDFQKKETAKAIQAMLGDLPIDYIQPTLMRGQPHKFTPWIFPFQDLRFLGDTVKSDVEKADARDIRVEDGHMFVRDKMSSFLFPALTRVSKKLLFDQDLEVSHLPRLTLDQVVLQRETWFLSSAELAAMLKFDSECLYDSFVRGVELQGLQGFPEQVFIETPGIEKNIFIDFRNFFSIELLHHFFKKTTSVKICEALPLISTKKRIEKDERCASFTMFLSYRPENVNTSSVQKD